MKQHPHIGLVAQGGAGWAGGTEYIRNLIRAIAAVSEQAARVSLFYGRTQSADWEAMKGQLHSLHEVLVSRRVTLLQRLTRRENAGFATAVRESAARFIYPLTYDNHYNVGVSLPLGRALGTARWAGWIPDFQHRHLPHLFAEKEIAKRERGIVQLVEEAPRVVLSSESAAADFRRIFPAEGSKVEVLRFATFPNADWYTPYSGDDLGWLPERFFLVCNQFWKHKNHLVLFEALRLLAARGIRPAVVCTGALVDFRDSDYANVVLQTIHRSGLTAQVMLVGHVARRAQIEMMRRSLAVVQPSLFEGWSTVVEDARVLGKASVLSDIEVHQEQNPEGAQFFQRDSAESLAEQLARAWGTLPAGIQTSREAEARHRAETRIVEVGARFLEIANRACS